MKTQVLLVATAAAAVATLLSCTRELSVDITQAFQEMTFTAAFSDEGTKTAIQPNGTSVWWTGEESINVFTSGGQSAKFISAGTEVRATAVFTGSFSGSTDGETFYAVYPYNEANSFSEGKITLAVSTQQTAVEESFADDLFPSVAASNNDVFRFYHVCGGARLSVSRNDIKQIVIKAKGEVPLAGTVKVGFNDSGKPVVNSCTVPSYEVRLLAPDNACFEPGKYYFAVLLPGAHTNGIEITYILSDGRSGAYTANSSISVNRALFGKLNNLDQGLEYQEDTGGIEPIDLGLSVKWAPFNVGATKPEEFGDYFAWGETEPKQTYNWSTYKWCNGSYKSLTKYNTSSSFGTVDNRTVLELFDDAAYANLGDNWRMPTDAEWGELIDNCTWAWTTVNGVYGYKVTSNKSGYTNKTIFLPASGDWGDDSLHLAGISGWYWSSSIDTDSPCARFVYFRSSEVYEDFFERYLGVSVRPVYGEFSDVSSIVLNCSSVSLDIGETAQLYASISPSNATEKTVHWVTNDNNVATVSDSGLVTAITAGTATITAYASNGKSASCTVTVKTAEPEPAPLPEAIDLGLSVKWASFNLGASSPTERGWYFAWGETIPYYIEKNGRKEWKEGYEDGYDWTSYRWSNGSFTNLTKYVTSDKYGTVDNKTVLDAADDAARQQLGGNWRMPSKAEWQELLDNCIWEETKDNNVPLYRVKSKMPGYVDNYIILPRVSHMSSTLLFDDDYNGHWAQYWSSDLYESGSDCAYSLNINWGTMKPTVLRGTRCVGMPIRPVYGDFFEVSSIVLNCSSVSLDVGETAQLYASISPSNATEKTIRWVSNNHNVVTVSESGLVTAKAVGSATITAYASNGKSASCTVTVKTVQQEPEPMQAGITVFEDDFEWMSAWSGNAPDDVGSNTVGTSPNIFFSSGMDTLLAEFQDRGYGYIWGYKDHDWSTDTPEGDTRTMYLQKNYLKFGKTSYNSGILLPVLTNVEGIADVELSFNWCWCMTGKAKPDIMTLTVVVSGGGTFASNGTEVGDNINSSQPTEDDLTVLEWQTAKLRINGVTPDTRITIRPTNCDPGVSSTRNQNRWYFDNVTIVTL